MHLFFPAVFLVVCGFVGDEDGIVVSLELVFGRVATQYTRLSIRYGASVGEGLRDLRWGFAYAVEVVVDFGARLVAHVV